MLNMTEIQNKVVSDFKVTNIVSLLNLKFTLNGGFDFQRVGACSSIINDSVHFLIHLGSGIYGQLLKLSAGTGTFRQILHCIYKNIVGIINLIYDNLFHI